MPNRWGIGHAAFAAAMLMLAAPASAEPGDRNVSVVAARVALQRELSELLTRNLQGPAEPFQVEAAVRVTLRARALRDVRTKQETPPAPAPIRVSRTRMKLPGFGTVEGDMHQVATPTETAPDPGHVSENVPVLETEVARLTVTLFVDPEMPKGRRELLARLASELAGVERGRGDDVVLEERSPGAAPRAVAPAGGVATATSAPAAAPAPRSVRELVAVCLTLLGAAAIVAWGLSRRTGGRGGTADVVLSGPADGETRTHVTATEPGHHATITTEIQRKRRADLGVFRVLEDATPEEIVHVLAESDARTATAIVDLYGLGPEAAELTASSLPPERQVEIGVGLATARVFTRDQLAEMEASTAELLRRHRNRVKVGGPSRLAEFFYQTPSAVRQQLMEGVAARDRGLADAARAAMLLFEDLPRLADVSIRNVMSGIDPGTVALALVGVPEVREVVLGAMSARLRSIVEAEEGLVQDRSAAEVEKARRVVEDTMRLAQQRGELRMRPAATGGSSAAA